MTSVIAFPFGQARPDPPLFRQSREVRGEMTGLRGEMHARFDAMQSRFDHLDREIAALSRRMRGDPSAD
jgi:hypothetical protein